MPWSFAKTRQRLLLDNKWKPKSDSKAAGKAILSTTEDDGIDPDVGLYEYQPLEKSDMIRVLVLHDNKNRLECTIKHIKVSDGEYQALSYEWGKSNALFRILVRNEKNKIMGFIPLTDNLNNALKDIRDSQGNGQKIFWIDQISINQNDTVEKGHQVEFMKSIYRDAKRVITYLGPHSSDMKEESQALELLDQLHRHFEPNYRYFSSRERIQSFYYDKSPLPVPTSPNGLTGEDTRWPALLHIVYGAWLRRLWMVQENVLGRNTVMLRGRQELDWMSVASIPLLFFIEALPESVLEVEWASLEIPVGSELVVNQMSLTWEQRHKRLYTDGSSDQFLPMWLNLTFYSSIGCDDPRDRVYALLGICSDVKELAIVPNYDLAVNDLYLQVSVRVYLTSKHLRFFELLSSHAERFNTNLPSWSYSGFYSREHIVEAYDPHPATTSHFRFEEQNKVMVVQGRVIDKIQFTTGEIYYGGMTAWDDASKLLLFKETIQAVALILEKVHYNSEVLVSLIQTFIAMPDWLLSKRQNDSAFYVWSLFRKLARHSISYSAGFIRNEAPFCDLIPQVIQRLYDLVKNSGKKTQKDPWERLTIDEQQYGEEFYAKMVVQGRAICISDNNRFCNTTGKARVGDVIALLAGGSVAFVLRPVGDKYRYIGDAYVHGLANGAAYEYLSPEEVDQEIHLI